MLGTQQVSDILLVFGINNIFAVSRTIILVVLCIESDMLMSVPFTFSGFVINFGTSYVYD
jgi:hypothetical protein